ncbi:MAG: hypothetical protein HYV96_05290 [Opitutae bacterium]|nr:hypothetical protein [Opitutae bacterium]
MNHSTTSTPLGAARRRFAALLPPAALVLSCGLVAAKLVAQPGGPGGPGEAPATFALSDVTASYAFSSEGDVERNGKIGTVEISHYEFEASFSLPAPDTWMFSSSLSWKRDEFEATGAVPLPKALEEIGLSFIALKNLSREIGPGWSTMAMLSPSFCSDSGSISGDSFSLFGVATIGKEVSPAFSWSVGIVGMTRGDMKVLPMLGVRWSFAPRWDLAIGFPRTGVSYKFSEALSLNAGLSMQGGTYYLSQAPAAGLGSTYLDFRETRLGVGAEYQFNPRLAVVIDGGMTLDREFDYYDRNLKLDGKSASYGRLSLRYRF